MPKYSRCKNFTKNGSPIHGGCRDNAFQCRYMHPEDSEFWEVVPDRCKYFDENKRPVRNGCKYSNHPSECLFAHPGEPEWEGKRRSDPRLKLLAPQAPLSSKIQTWDGDRLPNPIPNRVDRPLQVATSIPHAIVDYDRDAIQTPVTVESVISSPTTSLISFNMPRDVSGNADPDAANKFYSNDTHTWKRRIALIVSATKKYQELKDQEHALELSQSLLNLAPPGSRLNLEEQVKDRHSEVPAARRKLEGAFHEIYQKLHETGFWSLPLVSTQKDDAHAELLNEIASFKERVARVKNLMKMRQEKQRKQVEKMDALREERPSLVVEHEDLVKRITDLEQRLQSLNAHIDDQEDEFERDRRDWSDQISELKRTHTATKDQELALGNLTDLDELSKKLNDLTDTSPLSLVSSDASDIATRFTSLSNNQQMNEDGLHQVFQDLNEGFLTNAKPNPVFEALQTVKVGIMSEIDACLGESRRRHFNYATESYNDAQRGLEGQVDPVVNLIKVVSKEAIRVNLNCS